jgi:arabinofuranosyltransferase
MRLPGMRFVPSVVASTLVVVVLALYAHHVASRFAAFTVDDAAISYAYANNLAHGNGFRLTPNASPVEGFSNPLEVLVLVPFAWVGADLDTACKFLNLAAVVGAVFAMAMIAWRRLGPWARLGIAVPCAFGFLWPAFNHWIVAGLEGGLLCGLQILSIALLAVSPLHRRRDTALGIVALLLALTRPEGVIYGGLVVAFRVVQLGRRWRPAAIFCIGVGCILVLRYALFRQWVANTYYAKMTVDTQVSAGMGYVGQFWQANGRAYFLCLLPLFAFAARWTWVAAAAALVQGVFANGFAVLSGGDWMRHWRFMQPLQGPFWLRDPLISITEFQRFGRTSVVRQRDGRKQPLAAQATFLASLE